MSRNNVHDASVGMPGETPPGPMSIAGRSGPGVNRQGGSLPVGPWCLTGTMEHRCPSGPSDKPARWSIEPVITGSKGHRTGAVRAGTRDGVAVLTAHPHHQHVYLPVAPGE